MWFVGLLVGAVIGGIGRGEGVVIGSIVGIILGVLVGNKIKQAAAADKRVGTLEESVNQLIERVKLLERSLASWRKLVSGAPLLNLQVGGQRLQQKRVELPQQKAKYLRLSWIRSETKAAAPEITAASGELEEKYIEAAREWNKYAAMKEAKAGEKEGEYLFDLKGYFPLDRLRLALPQANTVAQIEVLVRDKAEQQWRSVARSVAYRLNRDYSLGSISR